MDNSRRENLIGVLKSVWSWRKAIRNICLLALVISVVVSLFLPNYFKSTTIFYPASPELANPELLFGTSNQVTKYFGTDQDLDRLAEIANSNVLMDTMIKKFDLYARYNIDRSSGDGAFKVRKQFRKLYVAQKNKNDALEISVEDKDPKLASDMANTARYLTDQIAAGIISQSQGNQLSALNDNISRKKTELMVLGDSLSKVQSKYGIYDPIAQGEQLAISLAKAEADVVKFRSKLEVLEPNPNIPRDTIAYMKANLRAAENQKALLAQSTVADGNLSASRYNEGLARVLVLRDLHTQARKQLSYDLERETQIKAVHDTRISSIHVIETAEPALKKSRPVRSLIVIGSVIGSFIFMVLAALMADAYRDVNWRSILED